MGKMCWQVDTDLSHDAPPLTIMLQDPLNQGFLHNLLAGRAAGREDVGRVAHHQHDLLLLELLKRRPVELEAIHGSFVNFPVPRVYDSPMITPHDETAAVGDGVGHADGLDPAKQINCLRKRRRKQREGHSDQAGRYCRSGSLKRSSCERLVHVKLLESTLVKEAKLGQATLDQAHHET